MDSILGDTKAQRLALDVTILREAEKRNRECGRFEQANALRMFCDAAENGYAAVDYCIFDRGVFDLYGPEDFYGMPFLIEVSPRLHPELYHARPKAPKETI